jgi:hypothetical protein
MGSKSNVMVLADSLHPTGFKIIILLLTIFDGIMGCRRNGLSEQWAVRIMGRRSNGLSE